MEDHRPFKFMKNPFVSGVMALETFMEAAHLLCPHLAALGVRNVKYLDILECPPGVNREARIVCRRLEENGGGEVLCDVSLSSPHITTTGRVLDRWTTNYTGQVILGRSGQPLPDWPGFTVKPEELDSAQFDQKGVCCSTENTATLGTATGCSKPLTAPARRHPGPDDFSAGGRLCRVERGPLSVFALPVGGPKAPGEFLPAAAG